MNTTIDQWEVLEAVVQLGSFAAAATKMNRSQSTISYAISRLQDQFKIPLLEMRGRKAHLTDAGKALLADVEPLLTGFRALEQRAESLAAGGQTEIRLSVESVFPNERLFAALANLRGCSLMPTPNCTEPPSFRRLRNSLRLALICVFQGFQRVNS